VKIIVGVDLSPASEHALAHAIDVARQTGAEVVMVLVDVVPEMPTLIDPASAMVAQHYVETLRHRLAADRQALAELRTRWQGHGPELSSLIVDGHPDERLTAVADEVHAALIVVGSHGRTGVRRWLIGSVAEHVVRLATQSVLVARGDAPAGGYQRVVIGTDFSAGAAQAVSAAIPLIAPNARVELVHAWGGPWLFPEAPAAAFESVQTALESALTDAAQQLAARLADQSPATGLTDVAAQHRADLIVVGSHGRRGVRRFLLGSVAEVTVRHAPCSVLVSR
jgi:nucleotide-binding universal stress UspA family protein